MLNKSQRLAYALPTIPVFFLIGPLFVVQGIYAKHFGMSLTSIAFVLLISRLFDALSDPLVGCFSDFYYSLYGSRKLFVAAGGMLFIVSSYFLFVPVGFIDLEQSEPVSFTYFLVWFLLFYFSFTLFEIPHVAWGAELSNDSHGKSITYGLRAQGMYIGTLLFYLVPLLPLFKTSDIGPKTLEWSVILAGILMLPLIYLCIRVAPTSCKPSLSCNKEVIKSSFSLRQLVGEMSNNGPLALLLLACLFWGAGGGMWYALQFIYIDAYLGFGDKFAIINILGLSIGSVILATAWVKLAYKFGKTRAWSIAISMYVTGIIFIGSQAPENTSLVRLTLIMIVYYFGFTGINIMIPSLMADIVDYNTWKFGTDRAAVYFAIYTFTSKTTVALGSAISLFIAGWYGFDPAESTHTDQQIYGLKLATAWLPAPIIMVSLLLIRLIPINSRRHEVIRRRIELRASRN